MEVPTDLEKSKICDLSFCLRLALRAPVYLHVVSIYDTIVNLCIYIFLFNEFLVYLTECRQIYLTLSCLFQLYINISVNFPPGLQHAVGILAGSSAALGVVRQVLSKKF